MFDGKAFGAEVVDIVKGFITKALHDIKIDIAGLIERVDDLELREPVNGKDGLNGKDGADGLPGINGKDGARGEPGKDGHDGLPGDDGQDADPELIAKHVVDKLNVIIDRSGSLVFTIDGKQHNLGTIVGKDGSDVDMDAIEKAISDKMSFIELRKDEAIATLERRLAAAEARQPIKGEPGTPGQPGRDADPETIVRTVREAVAAMPKPQDGKSVTVEDVKPAIIEAVAQWLKANPPEDGKDADPEAIFEAAQFAVSKIPVPKDGIDGKDAPPIDPDKIRVAVEDYFKWSPVQHGVNGANGKDADPAVIERMVMEAVSKLPKAKDGADGKDVDPAIVERMINDAVSKLPAPKDGENGKDADPDEIAELVNKAVTTAVAASPKAKDAIGWSSALIDKDGHLVLTRTDGMVCDIGRICGSDGKEVDLSIIEKLIEDRISIALDDTDKSPIDLMMIPDDVCGHVAKAISILAESPPINTRQNGITVNVSHPSERQRKEPVRKTITTRRDANGNITADVIEQPEL